MRTGPGTPPAPTCDSAAARRYRASCRSRPSNRMPPPVGSSRPSTSFAVVVLPQPDSPTTPSVRPLSMANETSSTARTTPRLPPNRPRRAVEMLGETRGFEHRHQAAPLCIAGARAASSARCVRRRGRTPAAPPARQRSNAAGQRAANAQPRGRRDRSGGWPSIAVSRWRLSAHARDRVQQRLGIGMRRRIEYARHRTGLHDTSRIHHRELVAHLRDDAEVVGDEDQR